MVEVFQTLFQGPQPWGMIITVVLIGCLAAVIGAIAKEIRKYGSHRQDVDFKRELVDRGLSADEIERIIQARPEEPPASSRR